jgi:hypothetical protein
MLGVLEPAPLLSKESLVIPGKTSCHEGDISEAPFNESFDSDTEDSIADDDSEGSCSIGSEREDNSDGNR